MSRGGSTWIWLALAVSASCAATDSGGFRTVADEQPLSEFANSEWDPKPTGHATVWRGALIEFGPQLSLELAPYGDSLRFTWREYGPDKEERDGFFDEHTEVHVYPADFLEAQAIGQDFILTLGRTKTGESVLHQWCFRPRPGGWFARTLPDVERKLGTPLSLDSRRVQIDLVGDEYLPNDRPKGPRPRVTEVMRTNRPLSGFALDPWGRSILWLDAREDLIYRSELAFQQDELGQWWPDLWSLGEPEPLEWPEVIGADRSQPLRPPEGIEFFIHPECGVLLRVSYLTLQDFNNENESLLFDYDNDGFFDAREEIEVLAGS